MKRDGFLIVALIVVAIIAGVGATMLRPHAPAASSLQAGDMQFEIADTHDKQELGLGNRASIPDNYGMLFVFQKPDRYGFWMKDMLVPIDITWLDTDGSIILIDHSVDPSTYPHAFYPPVPVKYVLETRAGYAKDHNWDVGTKVSLPAPY
ncbi:MAG: DUF192 domain-containing protein [Bacillota bacterium]